MWTSLDSWIAGTAVAASIACALPGNFLILRRMSMMGDAISHAVLPGLAVAFLVTGARASFSMFVGAVIVGVLTALFTQWIHRSGRVDEGAAMGVVFTSLFALGLVLIVQAADSVDLDPGCVLYGALELTPLDTWMLAGHEVPRALVINATVLVVNLCIIGLFYKELKITSFDPELGKALGFRPGLMHYLLMSMVAVTTVAAFESVGSILVIAMLIVPGATAYLLTGRLSRMILVSILVAGAGAVLGHWGAITIPVHWGFEDTSTAGSIAVVEGLLFMAALIASPRQGLVIRYVHQLGLSLRVTREDILGLLYRTEELAAAKPVTGEVIARAMDLGWFEKRLALLQLVRGEAIQRKDGAIQLTAKGRDQARNLIRTHRLWESYLYAYLGLPPDHLHVTPERLEHVTDSKLQLELDQDVGHPDHDPHGHTIPRNHGADDGTTR